MKREQLESRGSGCPLIRGKLHTRHCHWLSHHWTTEQSKHRVLIDYQVLQILPIYSDSKTGLINNKAHET